MIDFVLRATRRSEIKIIGGVCADHLRKTKQRDFRSVSSPDYAMQINAVNKIIMDVHRKDQLVS